MQRLSARVLLGTLCKGTSTVDLSKEPFRGRWNDESRLCVASTFWFLPEFGSGRGNLVKNPV